MECPLLKHRRKFYGRVALAVGLVGLVYSHPPQNTGEWLVTGAGAYVGLIAVDHFASTYPTWSVSMSTSITSMGSGKTACGCGK